MHTFNPSTWEAERERDRRISELEASLFFIELVPEHPRLHKEILSPKTNKICFWMFIYFETTQVGFEHISRNTKWVGVEPRVTAGSAISSQE